MSGYSGYWGDGNLRCPGHRRVVTKLPVSWTLKKSNSLVSWTPESKDATRFRSPGSRFTANFSNSKPMLLSKKQHLSFLNCIIVIIMLYKYICFTFGKFPNINISDRNSISNNSKEKLLIPNQEELFDEKNRFKNLVSQSL